MSAAMLCGRCCRLGLVLLLLCGAVMHGQFNGPADTARDTVNAPHPITTDPAILYPPARNPVIQVGDVLRFTMYGVADYTAQDRVSAEGAVVLPLLTDAVPLEGLTVPQAQTLVSQRYNAAQMFKRAQIRVEIMESPKSVITLLGEVRGNQPAPAGSRRLFEVLAASGGLPTSASHVLSIDRPGLLQSINVDLGSDPEQSKYANIPIFPGDTITTGSIGRFYLLGGFNTQGAFSLSNTAPTTILTMLAQGGGKPLYAHLDRVHIIRTVGTQRTLVTVNVSDVLKGHAPDPVIQSDDIIIAPTDYLKRIISVGGLTTLFGIGLTFYELFRT